MKNKPKLLWILGPVLAIAVAFAGWALLKKKAAPAASAGETFVTATAQIGEIALKVEASGIVNPVDEVSVRSEVNGEVLSIAVKVGEYVRKGQLLAEIDASDARIELEKARASYLSAQANLTKLETGASASELEQSRASLRQSEINLASNKAELGRAEALFQERLITLQQLETYRNQVLSSQESVRSAKAKLDQLLEKPSAHELASARAQVTSTKLSLETLTRQYAQLSGDVYSVRAPVDGLILEINGKVGSSSRQVSSAGAETSLITIADPSRLEVEMEIDESDLSQIAVGLPVTFNFLALEGQEFSGRITSLAAKGTVSNGVTVFSVTASIEKPGSSIRPGMNADATVWLERHSGVLLVPSSAIVEKMGRMMVRLPGNGEPMLKRVEIGAKDDTNTEILSGLAEGDAVLVPKKKLSTNSGSNSGSNTRVLIGGPGLPMGGIRP